MASPVAYFQCISQMAGYISENHAPCFFFRYRHGLFIHSNLHRAMKPFFCDPYAQHLN